MVVNKKESTDFLRTVSIVCYLLGNAEVFTQYWPMCQIFALPFEGTMVVFLPRKVLESIFAVHTFVANM